MKYKKDLSEYLICKTIVDMLEDLDTSLAQIKKHLKSDPKIAMHLYRLYHKYGRNLSHPFDQRQGGCIFIEYFRGIP